MDQPPTNPPDAKHASDYLANERTFLAWIRTSVAVISLGFVIAKFHIWLKDLLKAGSGPVAPSKLSGSFEIGLAMMALGGLLTLLAAWRYHVVNRQIEQGKVSADRALIVFVTILVLALAAVMIVTMITTAGE